MGLSKTFGPVTISESAGVVSIQGTLPPIGGGSMAGVVSGFLALNLSALHLMDAGLALLAEKFPSLSVEIKAAQALLDAELAKA